MTTYKTTMFGDTFEISANFAQASDQIMGIEGGRQVADFRHSPEAAMKAALEQYIVQFCDDPDDYADAIADALDAMTEED
jgi:hypothetical protein